MSLCSVAFRFLLAVCTCRPEERRRLVRLRLKPLQCCQTFGTSPSKVSCTPRYTRSWIDKWATCGLPVVYLCITCSKHCKTNSKSNPLTFYSIYPRSFLKCSIKCQMFEKFEETQANLQQLHSDSRDPHRGTTMFGSCKSHAISKQDISWCQNRLAEWFKWAVAKCYRWHVQRTTKACSYSWNLA